MERTIRRSIAASPFRPTSDLQVVKSVVSVGNDDSALTSINYIHIAGGNSG